VESRRIEAVLCATAVLVHDDAAIGGDGHVDLVLVAPAESEHALEARLRVVDALDLGFESARINDVRVADEEISVLEADVRGGRDAESESSQRKQGVFREILHGN